MRRRRRYGENLLWKLIISDLVNQFEPPSSEGEVRHETRLNLTFMGNWAQ